MSRFKGSAARLGLAALAVAAVLSAGCLISRQRTIRTQGKELTTEDLAVLQVGQTTRAQVEAMFGPPTSVLTASPETEVLLYVYESKETSRTGVFLVYNSIGDVTQITTYRFEFTDGVLTGYQRKTTE